MYTTMEAPSVRALSAAELNISSEMSEGSAICWIRVI